MTIIYNKNLSWIGRVHRCDDYGLDGGPLLAGLLALTKIIPDQITNETT